MLDLVVVPGESLGEFYLGMPLSEAIAKIQAEPRISSVELKYHETEPLSSPIIVDLYADGVILNFEPVSQRLQLLEVYKPSSVQLRYSDTVFCNPETVCPTMALINEHFGPSFPGDYELSQHFYNVHYPGLSFTFPIPPEYASYYSDPGAQPLELPNGDSPITSRITIYFGPNINQTSLPPIDPKNSYFEEVIVRVSERIEFVKKDCRIGFNSSTQDVVNDLGPPDKIYYKEQDKMKIHSTGAKMGIKGTEYFYNYFTLGVDFLFDVNTHTVKKIILHTNFPSHYDFNKYTKCNFRILDEANEAKINANTKWSEVQALLGESGKPVVHKRKLNPFGSTFYYGYKDVIFETMGNGYIASVCLFKSEVDDNDD